MLILRAQAEGQTNSRVNAPVVLEVEAIHRAARAAVCTFVIYFVVAVRASHRSVQRTSGNKRTIPVNKHIATARVRDINLVDVLDDSVTALNVVRSPEVTDVLAGIDLKVGASRNVKEGLPGTWRGGKSSLLACQIGREPDDTCRS